MNTTTEHEINEIYNYVVKLVTDAGQYIRQAYQKGTNKDFQTKSDFYDLCTVYDKKIEEIIMNGIGTKYPTHKFIGEEETAASKRIPILTNEPTWIIDPIDGTTNFIRKIPHACISIALAVNQILQIGIIYNPVPNELYTAKRGQGAYLNDVQICVNNCKALKESVIGYEISLIHAESVRDKNIKRLYKIGTKAQGIRSFGSAALSLCYLAAGLIDCYHIDDLKPWDLAAGVLIVREAGGIVLNPTGGQFDIMKPDILSAASNELAAEVIAMIEEANQITEYTFS